MTNDAAVSIVRQSDARRLRSANICVCDCARARDSTVLLDAIVGVIDIETFDERVMTGLVRNDIARVTQRGLQPLVVDTHPAAPARLALYRGDAVSGGGIVQSVVLERDASRRSSPDVASIDDLVVDGHGKGVAG